jgi:hypothetical protein
VMERLGATYTLSPALFSQRTPSAQKPRLSKEEEDTSASPSSRVAYCDDALPEILLSSIESGLAWSSSPLSFWGQHDYGYPSTPYHSYLYPLSSQPSNAIESAIQALRAPLARRWPRLGAEAVAVEWWVHARQASEGHQLHFDLDEASAGRGHALRHPICSSVLFLSSVGGPTVVTSQRLGDGNSRNATAQLVPPLRNRLLLFDGALLHGVLPGVGAQGAVPPSDSDGVIGAQHRITLMLAWHGEGVSRVGVDAPLGPLRLLDPRAPWLTALFRQGLFQGVPVSDDGGERTAATWVEPRAWSPVWEHISELGDAGGEEEEEEGVVPRRSQAAVESLLMSGVAGEGLRYLLNALDDFDNLYLHGGAASP